MKYILTESQISLIEEQVNDRFYERIFDRYNFKAISYEEVSGVIKKELNKELGVLRVDMEPQTPIGKMIAETSAKIMDDFRNHLRYIDESPYFLELVEKIETGD